MPGFGQFKKEILIIGDSNSVFDDKARVPFKGKAGRLLETTLKELGVDLYEDCFVSR